MGVLKLKISLGEEALAMLNEVTMEEKDPPTAAHFLFKEAIRPRVKETAETRKLIHARGSLTLPNGKEITVSDLDSVGPLESYPDGQIEIPISDRVKGWIEETAGYIAAVNRLSGTKLQWTTPREYVREICLAAIATKAAKIDADELDEDEKAFDKPPAHTA